ncbi:MAG: peptidoglycan/xylan/chitin deacetylase (PgdA/CDA1 family) [Verrucomicrobiales bacterium]|jgi:peptidoglycan/xylan/chitin deacetylase (PgdA/CDA1 family)
MMRVLLIASNLLAPLVLVVLWIGGLFWLGLAILFVTHMLTLVATLVPTCPWWGTVVTRTDGDGVWLTIDDGPDPEDTPEILRLLAGHDAQATFFVIGEKAQRWPELIQAIQGAGHGIENHTLSHPQFAFWRLGPARVQEEIEGGQRAIAEVLEEWQPSLFRAPAGMRNVFVHPVLKRLGLKLIAWSARGRDGVSTDRDAIIERLEAGIEPGAILLMHEGMRDEDGRSVILDTLPRVLKSIRDRGLKAQRPFTHESCSRPHASPSSSI